jgi:hypothetical protein
MKIVFPRCAFVVHATFVFVALTATGLTVEGSQPDEARQFFREQVKPLIEDNCLKCHGMNGSERGGLRMTTREELLRGGELGPAVDLDDPSSSMLLEAVTYESLEMPPSGKLSDEQIDIFRRWVEMGAPWGDALDGGTHEGEKDSSAPEVDETTKAFWSFQPLSQPSVPVPHGTDWIQAPIDAFILDRLERAALSPAPPASRASLLRRAYYDLIGLPPTPEQVQAFMNDTSEDAFERVVDQLLDSPHYGEKWGRYWLDLVRFAETNSYERDGAKPFAWRYRDYVIRSFNEDKPYDRFILEQLAGDELAPDDPDAIIATGYYRLGIWQDEPVDMEQSLYDDLDDILGTTGQVFMGLTINCARCHEHKLDPIPQRDYYRMLAFFNGITRLGVRSAASVEQNSLRTIATAEQRRQHAAENAEHNRQLADVERQLQAIESRVKQDFAPVEHEEFKHEQHRLPLVRKRVPKVISRDEYAEYSRLMGERKKLKEYKPAGLRQALCVTEIGPKARDTHVLIRGNAHAKGELVQPGFLSVLSGQDPLIPASAEGATTSGRRSVFARWLASPDHPLTARVMANRVWQYHFGRGIVASPNNFGLQGEAPTHPELLDYLARMLIQNGWRVKPLHKAIMLSSTYQMSAHATDDGLAKDPMNTLWWRFNMRRLSAEEIRDSILAVNGSLNPKMFGPGIYPIVPEEVLAGQSRPGSGWGTSSAEERDRRSVYIHVKRSLLTPLLASFDYPDPDATCPVRFATTQPTQALAMLNSDFVGREAEVFANYVRDSVGDDIQDQAVFALERVLQRVPTDDEVERAVQFIDRMMSQYNQDAENALAKFCLLALNVNEFVYVD